MKTRTPFQVNSFAQERFPRVWEVVQNGLEKKTSPGFAAGIWEKKRPGQIWSGAWGNRREIPSPLPLHTSTVFDLASVSKVMGTAPLAAVLIDRGWLSWDTSVKAVFPNYSFPEIQFRHLLSHTAGFTPWRPYWERLNEKFHPRPIYSVPIIERQNEMRRLILQEAPGEKPGVKAIYSDVSFLLLGFLLEELTQMPLDRAVKKWVWEPMGLPTAQYRKVIQSPLEAVEESIASTEESSWRGGILQGQVHDDNCWAMGGYAGHAGAFGTVEDVLYFVRSLMTGFLSQKTLNEMWTRVPEPSGCERTLGWDTPSGPDSSVGQYFSSHTVGHLGFTGTSLWIDLDAELAVVLLSNRVHPSRENIQIREFRKQFHTAVRLDWTRAGSS